ncbi:Pumilio-family RNA binding repeat-containing protein [Toxoplasma gondii ME49]|uniref:Pumilio-family RNA binding repeat-containing protein n=5 Tax=Toxoplasma gondii TaxID=5811 RepID=S7UKD2_TOXGG|nr:Pumilio-family RNA binding repeat-containing protein [Toxoplasma gondii ME49]EPR58212.1 Pumilio-family RNA binding repeat-containing protein [Toxoplasma gondii GT1]EPT31446.1 Pumilio-family RNA binding repeat-containing protein [Toxoplasma gondii ME49]KAF4645004.1 Pumilio-family RNA binding repeat-containing protein [Toxoplasma gondii]|eukprot:XP_002369774.1 Pumilio-family RNA binding repeat-containing protein [Toxoplasma gondii ME49]
MEQATGVSPSAERKDRVGLEPGDALVTLPGFSDPQQREETDAGARAGPLSPLKGRPEERPPGPLKGHRDSTASASTQASHEGRRSSGRLDAVLHARSSLSSFASFDSQRSQFTADDPEASLLAQIEEGQEEAEGGRQASCRGQCPTEATQEDSKGAEHQHLECSLAVSREQESASSSSLPVQETDFDRESQKELAARQEREVGSAGIDPSQICPEAETQPQDQRSAEGDWEEPPPPSVSCSLARDQAGPRSETPFCGLGSREAHAAPAYSCSFPVPSALYPPVGMNVGVPAEVERAFSVNWMQTEKGTGLQGGDAGLSFSPGAAGPGASQPRVLGPTFAAFAPPPGMSREDSPDERDTTAKPETSAERVSDGIQEEARNEAALLPDDGAQSREAEKREADGLAFDHVPEKRDRGTLSPRARATHTLEPRVQSQAASPVQTPDAPEVPAFDGRQSQRESSDARRCKALSFLPQGLGLGEIENSVLLDVLVALGMEREERGAEREGGPWKEKLRLGEWKDVSDPEKSSRRSREAALEGVCYEGPDTDASGHASSLHGAMSSSTHSPSPISSSPLVSSHPCPPPSVSFSPRQMFFSPPSSPGLPFPAPQQPPGVGADRERRDAASGRGASPSSLRSFFQYSSPSSPSSIAPSSPQSALQLSPFACWRPMALPSLPETRRDGGAPPSSPFFISEEELSLLEHLVATERQKRENMHAQAPPRFEASLLERLLLLRDAAFARQGLQAHAGDCGVSPVSSDAPACVSEHIQVRATGSEGARGPFPDVSLLLAGEYEKKRLLQSVRPHFLAPASPAFPPTSAVSSPQRNFPDLAGPLSASPFYTCQTSRGSPPQGNGAGGGEDRANGRGTGAAKEIGPGLQVRPGPAGGFFVGCPGQPRTSPLDFASPEAPQRRPGCRTTRSPVSAVAASSPSGPGAGGAAEAPGESRRGRKKRENRRRGAGPPSGVAGLDAATAPLPLSCSAALRHFRLGTISPFTLRDVGPNALEFAKDPFAAVFLQEQLETCPLADRVPILFQLLPHALDLAVDQHGNYVLQKFFETGCDKEKEWLAAQLTDHVFRLSLEVYGCRVIQRAVESLPVPAQLRLVRELKDHVITCVEDQHGNHVIQKCAERLPSPSVQFIIDAFKGQEARMSVHSYGCRVIQRLLEACPMSQVAALIDVVMAELCMLIRDQFGNYVVQHVLEFGRDADKMKIIDFMCEDIIALSTEKYACNVVERALTLNAMGRARRRIITAALGPEMMGQPLKMVMLDRYGNYVVQRMMEVAPDDLRPPLLRLLREHVDILKKFTYGKHIVTALERLENSGANASGSSSPPPGYSTSSPKDRKTREALSRTVSAPLAVGPPGQPPVLASSIPRPRSAHPPPPRTEPRGASAPGPAGSGAPVFTLLADSSFCVSPSSLAQPPPALPPLAAFTPRVPAGSATPQGEGGKGPRGAPREGPRVSFSGGREPAERVGSGQAKPSRSEKARARGEKARASREKAEEAGKAGASRAEERRLKAGLARAGDGGDSGKGRKKEREEAFGASLDQSEKRTLGGGEKGVRRRDGAAGEKSRRSPGFSASDESPHHAPVDEGKGRDARTTDPRDEQSSDLQQWVSVGRAFSKQASALAALQRYFLTSLSPPPVVRSPPRAPSAHSQISHASTGSSGPSSLPTVRAEVQRASTFGSLGGSTLWESSSSEPPSPLPSFSLFSTNSSGAQLPPAGHSVSGGRPGPPQRPSPGVSFSPESPSVLSEVMDLGGGSLGSAPLAWPRRERAKSDCVPSSFPSFGRGGPLPPLASLPRDPRVPAAVHLGEQEREQARAGASEESRRPTLAVPLSGDANVHASGQVQDRLLSSLHGRQSSAQQGSSELRPGGENKGGQDLPGGRAPSRFDEEARNAGNVLSLTPEMMNEVLKAFQQCRPT